jgi:hypothetical protein
LATRAISTHAVSKTLGGEYSKTLESAKQSIERDWQGCERGSDVRRHRR